MPGYRVRVASANDEEAILDALRHAQRVAIHADPARADGDRVADLIRRCSVTLLAEDDRLAGICAAAIGPPTVAQVRVFAARDRWREQDVLRALLPSSGASSARRMRRRWPTSAQSPGC